MIHIRQITKKELAAFVDSPEYKSLEFVPISPQRAISHYSNPRALDTDTLLFLAYEEKELVGYLGTFPDHLFQNGNKSRVAWLSCLWISNKHRGKKIAFKLVSQAIEVWEQSILVTEFTGPAKRLYDKTGNFEKLSNKKGIRLYLRMNLAHILPPKHRVFNACQRLLSIIDKIANGVLDLRFYIRRKAKSNLQIGQVKEIDAEIDNYIRTQQKDQLFKRDKTELNWIINKPWIVDHKTGDPYADKYYFSSVAKTFEFIPLKIRDQNNQLVAFLLFAKRDKHLKLPYCYYSCDQNELIKIINQLMIDWKVSMFSLFHDDLASAFEKAGTPALYKKGISRNYIISSKLKKADFPASFSIQDGDADCSFT